MMDTNVCVFTGNLTKDPEMAKLHGGKEKCKFRLAVNGRGESTMFIGVNAWDAQADVCMRFLKKGARVLVRGRLDIRDFENSENKRVTVTELNLDEIQFLSGTKTREESEGRTPQKYTQGKMDGMPPADPVDDDDLPF